MAKLILHVGPGKCGSSSIQQFFATHKNPCVESTNYIFLNPRDILILNKKEPNQELLIRYADQISESLLNCDTLILSNESLFQNPYTIKNICSLAESLVEKIFIIGYSRRQSGFLVSAYSQWLFRSSDRVNEIENVLDELELDSDLFTGLEKQLIASINNDFYSARQLSGCSIMDWNNSYTNISKLVSEHGALIKCGVLPKKRSHISLIQDFCEKSDLTLDSEMKGAVEQIVNLSFNQDIVEAMNNAISFGLDIPAPHDMNKVIGSLSSKIRVIEQKSSEFLSNLKSYIDTYYFDSNIQLCNQYNLDETYFLPAKRLRKSEIMELIFEEGRQRSLDKSSIIKNYRMLSSIMVELCIKLANGK